MPKGVVHTCKRCGKQHWRFVTCEEAARERTGKAVDVAWAERPEWQPWGDRLKAEEQQLLRGRRQILPPKNPDDYPLRGKESV